jgi:two-component system, cell cycle response regulator
MSSSSSERVARQDRLRAVTTGRVVTTLGLALLLGTVAIDLIDPAGRELLAVTALAHLAIQTSALLATRQGRFLRPTVELTMLADVAALAVLLAFTGGVASPLVALLLPEIVAVTLLFGRWAGLRVSLLSTLVIAWLLTSGPGSLSDAATAVRVDDPAVALALDPTVRAALLLIALWATTFVTGWLADVIERDLRRNTEDLALLREVTPDLDPRQGPHRVAEVLTDLLVERLEHEAAAVWLVDHGRLVLSGERGTKRRPEGLPPEFVVDLPLDAMEVGQALAGTRVHPIAREQDRPAALLVLFGERAPLALVPLAIDDRPMGMMAVSVRVRLGRGPILRPREVRLLRMLGEQAALLLENARLQAELADQAVTDAVTGLPNHRFMQQRLGEELERVARSAGHGDVRPLSVALLDLDHFKVINDTFGHPTGDRVLAAVADAAQRTLRGTDIVCRYGGEEFALVLPDTDVDAARLACERVRLAVRDLELRALDGRDLPPVTASIGITTLVGRAAERSTVLAAADEALYEAKRAGRDRVVHADDRNVATG